MAKAKQETKVEFKVRENRMRRVLKRMGYLLVKSPRRDPRAYDYGGYMILDLWSKKVVRGNGGKDAFCLTLDDVEAFTKE
jgi:hypothetical protein